MEDLMDFAGLFLIIVIAVAIKSAKKQNGSGKGSVKPGASRADYKRTGGAAPYSAKPDLSRYDVRQDAASAGMRQPAGNRKAAAAYARELKTKDSATARSNYGRSAFEFDSSLRAAAASSGHSSGSVRTQVSISDDRQNDWLAQQLRYERRVKAGSDLGATHEINCDARSLKREHIPRHGLD